jgi:hypothetical protein
VAVDFAVGFTVDFASEDLEVCFAAGTATLKGTSSISGKRFAGLIKTQFKLIQLIFKNVCKCKAKIGKSNKCELKN